MTTIVNWREADPVISHESAVVWACLQPKEGASHVNEKGAPASVLDRLDVVTVHAIQGRRQSDHHKHEHREQVYYVISGHGEIICGDTRRPIKAGDALYLPSGLYHQVINPGEDWLVHHVISRHVDGDCGCFLQRNWRDVKPVSDRTGAMRWHLLGVEGEAYTGALRGLNAIDRETVQTGGRAAEQCYDTLEQIYYILEGQGLLIVNAEERSVTEGDMIHLPTGVTYSLINTGEEGLTYLIIAGK